ncbi:MAG: DUF4080 domain-containing protein [Ruminococcaceae bacterium]|nr:DUF4080 domain-containing protein [Oscillospiraceae bacterium]
MEKFLFVAVNAKYVHTNLAVRYLRNSIDYPSVMKEYTINDDINRVCAEIFKTGIRNILFSCYIWNIEYILKLCENLKKADSSITISLGGPEVSFSPEEIFEKSTYVDLIICGEGEPVIKEACQMMESGIDNPHIIRNDISPDLNDCPFPYEGEDIELLDGRILYYETSRGCPFRCAFCLSGACGNVRYLDLERVKREIEFFINNNVRLVKFVDRTFNSDAKRALEIVNFIKQKSKVTTFHFEIKAELMTPELVCALATSKKGMFQVEIGVQSTNKATLRNIKRTLDIEKLGYVVSSLKKNDNINVHLDLIAGLPGETIVSFINSFNEVLSLRPHVLQLGFLKKLKGAELDGKGSKFLDFPPYEVVASDKMGYGDILRLKTVEEVLEKYYNSGSFKESMTLILDTYYKENPFDFFDGFGKFYEEESKISLSKKAQFEVLFRYCSELSLNEEIANAIIIDYCKMSRDNLSFMKPAEKLKEKAFEFLKNNDNVNKYFKNHDVKLPTQLFKKLRFERIGEKIYVFDYINNEYYDITEDMPKGW